MPVKPSPLEIYMHLPKKNCGECEFPTCMAFAAAIMEHKTELGDCPHLSEADRLEIEGILAAPVARLTFGTKRPLTIGEARVMHRHQLKFYNPTAVTVEVTDVQTDVEVESTIRRALETKVEMLGETYGVDSISVASVSRSKESFARTVRQVVETSDLPIILNSWEPEVLEAGLDACGDERPLIFAATRDSLESYMELAKRYRAPLTVADQDVGELRLMAREAEGGGVDVALYPVSGSLAEALRKNIAIRRAAIENRIRELGHPIVVLPRSLIGRQLERKELWWREALIASALIFRYADALILENTGVETLLPMITLRQSIFSDPKVPAEVRPGLHRIGSPGKDSPVLLTVNYALTFFLVSGDVGKAGMDCHLLVTDTEGMSVLNALVGGQLQPRSVVELIKQAGLDSEVSHRTLIIPGLAARLRGELEELSGWEIVVGPNESRDIPSFLKELPEKSRR
ncbi:acetyl-CoA decarbonylase/synthase complex subunit gamma [Candidatus Bathyarchaeota archaeon]|nr:acetyl-CoA decarbonylase/synthase complex subunit gamma [Candidatus Bathyarchaeota archaeon]